MKKFKNHILKIFSSLISNKNWRRLTKVASGITVFITVYMLILPALTLEHDTAVDMPGISDIELWEDSFEDQEMALDETWEEDDDFWNGEQPDLADGQDEYGFAGAELSDLDVFDLIEDEEMEDLTESLTEVEFPGEEDIPESPVIETGIGALFEAVTEVVTEKTSETEVMTEKTYEMEVMTETGTEAATEETTEKATEKTTEQATEETTEQATETTTEKRTEEVTENTTEKATENATEEATEDVTEETTEAVSEAISEEAEEALTEDITEEMSETEEVVNMPAQKFHSVTSMGEVHVEAGEGAFPEGTTMRIRNVTDEEIIQAVTQSAEQDTEAKVSRVFALDITFYNADGEEIQPMVPIRVNMTDRKAPEEGEAAVVVHVDQEGNTDLINDIQVEDEAGRKANVEVSFDAEKFSVYAVAYTVDFHWEVDGQIYDFSIPGGSCVQLSQIVEILGIGGSQSAEQTETEDTITETEENAEMISEDVIGEDSSLNTVLNVQISDRTREFVEDVENVAFSDPDLVWVGKVESDTTVGAMKENEGLEAEYAAGLSEEQISLINSQVLQTGDWALISLLPFLSEESLTVTMKNGEVFTIMVTDAQITERYMTASGESYVITVTYDQEAGIPDDARLSVSEITEDLEAYGNYVEKAEDALGWETGTASYIRIFDIKIFDHDGNKVEIQAPVDVKVELADKEEGEEAAQVVHFADGSETGEVVTFVEDEGETVSFVAEGFSAYAIVEGPEAITLGWHKVGSIEELIELAENGLYIGHTSGYYFTDGITQINSSRTGITKTTPAQASNPPANAVKYYFDQIEGSGDQFKVYCLSGYSRKYIVQTTNSLNFTLNEADASVFTIEPGTKENVFRAKGSGDYYWNMQGGTSGKSFAAYTGAEDVNAQFYFWYRDEITKDPYDLGGKSYGLMAWNNSVAGKAMMANQLSESTLEAKALTVMRKADNSDQLFAPNDSDISMWKFQWVEADRYYLTADVNGSTRYLSIGQNGLSLISTPDDSCRLQVVPGTGIHAGEICLKASGSTLTFSGTVANGFGVGGSVGSEWLHLVDLSELTSDYFRTYSASKVSVSSEDVTNGSRVIVYTRSWNEVSKKYDFYAIGSDGTLVPVYETGDSIEWVSGQINQLLWNFVEYYWEGTNDPNFYYELYNQYSEKFLAPQVSDGQILSDDTIGINLNGRRDGKYYSTIMAWDDESYSYTSLKVDDGHIVSCPKSEAMDFYFAIMQDLNVDDMLTSVPTVDNDQYGITMKLRNIKTRAEMSNFLGNDDGGIGDTLQQGLLSTDLDPVTSYPKAAGGSLSTLYNGATEVNHLFIDSIYQSSGYFMYDSTQNFASLNNGNDFTVYKEIGTYDSSGGRPTLKHGEFFPFNDLKPGVFASTNGKNLYDISSNELPDSDPRKYEQLYTIEHDGQKADTYFAMELEANFTQTPSGLDAWGHDIIFEFTGDDDFWLYVDGELVIDLGGIHSAVPGDVNFRTGEVNVNGMGTSLKDLFYSNYLGRNHTASEAEAYVDELFEQNKDGQWVFKDYTNHTMRIFYMERGAGASNLKMKFNLAAVKKNTVQLNKKLSGVDSSESIMAEFPYQILYKKGDIDEEFYLKNAVAKRATQNDDYVYYMDTVNPVHYEESFTIDGIEYNDVFLLNPDETAEINFPEGTVSYRIIECGVNTSVYNKVEVNNVEVTGRAWSGYPANRKDFGIDYASTDERAKVNYVNHVDPNALKTLTFKKKLFKEDGTTEINYTEDQTLFSFRLYLASEFGTLDAANMHTYHVKDPDGYYCSWDKAAQKFVRIGGGITSYENLSAVQKEAASFTTSIYGQVSKIPVGHTIEVRNVLAGTRYRVEERTSEIPDGYSFQKYDNYDDDNASPADMSGVPGVNGTVVTERNANVDVCNLKGWGLRMYKVWTDADYMAQRDAAYFAVYTDDGEGNLTLVDGTVRRLQWNEKPQTLYWYFKTLPVTGVTFDRYLIREVMIKDPVVDTYGNVTGSEITRIEDGGELKINGKQKGESVGSEFTYTVTYEKGTQDAESNVRVDTVTNNRPGIVLKKQDCSGHALAGATFTLHDNIDNLIGTFTSDEEGMITVAFLRDDVNYVLTETKAPQGYHGLQNAMTISLHNGKVTVTDVENDYYILQQPDGGTPTLTVKNRPYRFEAVKVDADTNSKLSGVTFALHRQVTVDGVTTIDLNPMPGYEELTTDDNGIIPGMDNTLPAGTYELREKSTLAGYEMLSHYIQFTISTSGTISLDSVLEEVELNAIEGNDILYRMTVKNSQSKKVSFVKVDIADTDKELEGAVFDLYAVNIVDGVEVAAETPLYSGLVSGEDGLLKDKSGNTVFDLPLGKYHLIETAAPAGYLPKSKAVVIEVKVTDVIYDEGTTLSDTNKGRGYSDSTKVYTLKISNSAGIELPSTGGIGTHLFHLIGFILVIGAGLVLAAQAVKRKNLIEG